MAITNSIHDSVDKTDSPEKVYDLFRSLGYPKDKLLDPSYKRKIDEFEFAKGEREKVKDIYTVFNYDKQLQIFLVVSKTLAVPFVRYITRRFTDIYSRFLLVFTSDFNDYSFVLPKFEGSEAGRQKLKITRLNFDRTQPYHTDLLTISNIALTGNEERWRDIWNKWKDAFSVEKVTDRFFEDYKSAFFELRKTFEKQKIPVKQSHELSQQVLNRLMFLYFIAKKRWLNDDQKFIKWYWERYKQELRIKNDELGIKDTFYEKWLQVLFLHAFNNQYSHPSYLPKDVDKVLAEAPYLNGGLFKKNDLDDLKFHISDALFATIFNFFEKYNFTIREELPLDVEVAVDPQMIGYVYESLSNVAEEIYERQDLGIFYTPTVEVDFMCRRTVVEYISNHLSPPSHRSPLPNPLPEGEGTINMNNLPIAGGTEPPLPVGEGGGEGYLSREWIYRLLFDEDKKAVAEHVAKQKLWYRLEEVLDNLAAVDPACGSGAFLVGMLHVLAELYRLIYGFINREMTEFELKKKIIGNSLYGVDVMPWAVHSAELRLWLQLIIEEDIPYEKRKLFPLLPNLNMKLRAGDSLVQEVGGISLHVRDSKLSPSIKRRLTSLKAEKEKYYNNDPTAKFKSSESLQQEELRIFGELLDDKIVTLQKDVQNLEGEKHKLQMNMFGEGAKEEKQRSFFEEQIKAIGQEIEHLRETKRKIQAPGQKPFVLWDIDFAEIFGDKGGFDIVIGNPPYVRQEKIAPPNKLKAEVTLEDKQEYKDKLLNSIQVHYPFVKKLDKKSDLYIYFYFHGLSLLNDKGTFCFITSNSWLDVGYGRDLQEFLLKYCHVKAIYDNEAKRSFERADVNTIIALFGPPETGKGTARRALTMWPALKETTRFIMFKKPFEEAINTKNLLAIEKADSIHKEDSYRVYPVKQEALLEEGWEQPEEDLPHPNPLPKGEGMTLPISKGEGIEPPLPKNEKTVHPLPVGEGRGEGVLSSIKSPLPDHLLKACRDLRKNSTDAEQLLWQLLRDRRINGAKFRRQHPIGEFILDFYCHESKLAIELDGGGHNEQQQKQYDEQRTKALKGEGIKVLRFWNHEVLQKTEAVIEVIWNALQQNPHLPHRPHPNPLPEGEGTKDTNKLSQDDGIDSDTFSLRERAGVRDDLGGGEGKKKRAHQPAYLLKEKFITGKYEGNKWGGKYLRAPDIYWQIIDKNKDKLTQLKNIGIIKPGCYSGLDKFFYIEDKTAEKLGIEKKFLINLIENSRQVERIKIDADQLSTFVFACHLSKQELKNNNYLGALDYIKWGEKQIAEAGQKRRAGLRFCEVPSVKNRQTGWWAIPLSNLIQSHIFIPLRIRQRWFVGYSNSALVSDRCFTRFILNDDQLISRIIAFMNSAFFILLQEVEAFQIGGGGGPLELNSGQLKNSFVLKPDFMPDNMSNIIDSLSKRKIKEIFDELGINPARPIREQKPDPMPDRKALDDIVFDILGLTEAERNEVYWAVCELVKNRLEKAKSV